MQIAEAVFGYARLRSQPSIASEMNAKDVAHAIRYVTQADRCVHCYLHDLRGTRFRRGSAGDRRRRGAGDVDLAGRHRLSDVAPRHHPRPMDAPGLVCDAVYDRSTDRAAFACAKLHRKGKRRMASLARPISSATWTGSNFSVISCRRTPLSDLVLQNPSGRISKPGIDSGRAGHRLVDPSVEVWHRRPQRAQRWGRSLSRKSRRWPGHPPSRYGSSGKAEIKPGFQPGRPYCSLICSHVSRYRGKARPGWQA